jgi:hypothetical protein
VPSVPPLRLARKYAPQPGISQHRRKVFRERGSIRRHRHTQRDTALSGPPQALGTVRVAQVGSRGTARTVAEILAMAPRSAADQLVVAVNRLTMDGAFVLIEDPTAYDA